MTCDRCGLTLEVGMFPFCRGHQTDHVGGKYGAIGDDIPGGLEIRHGLCHADGSPRRFYSKSEIAKAAKAAGLTNYVRHTDDDQHISRWV